MWVRRIAYLDDGNGRSFAPRGAGQGSQEDTGVHARINAPELTTWSAYSTWAILRVTQMTMKRFSESSGNCDKVHRPAPGWRETGLLSAGNIYLLRHDYDRAIDSFRELQQRFPDGGRASYALWKATWLSLRQGRRIDAEKGFEQQIELYPTSAEFRRHFIGGGGWRKKMGKRRGSGLLSENLGSLSELLLWRVGAAATQETQTRQRSGALRAARPHSSDRCEHESNSRPGSSRQSASAEGAASGEWGAARSRSARTACGGRRD